MVKGEQNVGDRLQALNKITNEDDRNRGEKAGGDDVAGLCIITLYLGLDDEDLHHRRTGRGSDSHQGRRGGPEDVGHRVAQREHKRRVDSRGLVRLPG